MISNVDKSSLKTILLRFSFIIMLLFMYQHQYLWRTFPDTINDILTTQYNLNVEKFSTLIASMYYPYLITQLFSGYIIQRYHFLLIVILSVGLHILGCWFFLEAHTFHLLVFSYSIVGAAAGMFTLLALHAAKKLISQKNYPLACGIIVATGLSGGIIGGTPFRWLTTIFDWRSILYAYSFIGILTIVTCAALYPLPSIKKRLIQPKQQNSTSKGTGLLFHPPLWSCSLYIIFQYAAMSFFVSTWLIPFAIADLGSHQLWIYGLNIWVISSYIVGSILFGAIARKYSKKLILLGLSIVGLIASAILVYATKDNVILFSACLVFIGLSLSAFPVILSLLSDTTEATNLPPSNAFVSCAANVGGVFLIYLVGHLIHRTLPQNELLQYKHIFFVVPLSFFLACFSSLLLPDSGYLSQQKN